MLTTDDLLAELDEMIVQAEEQQDYCSEKGPNEAMKRAALLRTIRAGVTELSEAATEVCEDAAILGMATHRLTRALQKCSAGWVLRQHVMNEHYSYLGNGRWSFDPREAIRFDRRRDAEAIAFNGAEVVAFSGELVPLGAEVKS